MGRGTKELSDLISPLRRWMEKQVGRPWDAVWSEVCERLRPTSVTQRHVLGHARDMVERNVRLTDGVVYSVVETSYAPVRRPLAERYAGQDALFVHPESGLLCRLKHRPWRARQTTANPNVVTASGKTYWCVRGIWYEILATSERYDRQPGWQSLYSANKKLTELYAKRVPDGDPDCPKWAYRWRQLSTKEIHQLGLRR